MIAVITGDIVASRRMPDRRKWLKRLQDIIERKTGLSKPPKWGVFRGDGFQVELADPSQAVRIAILIRAGLRSLPEVLDARMGIGIGEKGFNARSVNESDGEAYQSSGNVLDSLKDKTHRLEVNTPWPAINNYNVALNLASVIIDDWTLAEAEVAWLRLSERKTQQQIAKKLKISQPAVHKRFNNAHYNEIEDMILFFEGELVVALQNSRS